MKMGSLRTTLTTETLTISFKQFFITLCWKDNTRNGQCPLRVMLWQYKGLSSGAFTPQGSVCCCKLFNEFLEAAGTKFIPQCKGISGTTGALAIDLTYQYDEVDIPIDARVLDIARIDDGEDEIGDQS